VTAAVACQHAAKTLAGSRPLRGQLRRRAVLRYGQPGLTIPQPALAGAAVFPNPTTPEARPWKPQDRPAR
jgi:hypothetical protein